MIEGSERQAELDKVNQLILTPAAGALASTLLRHLLFGLFAANHTWWKYSIFRHIASMT